MIQEDFDSESTALCHTKERPRKTWEEFHQRDTSYQLGRGHIKPIILDRGVRFGYKMSQIVPKWGKSVTFSDQISVHFGLLSHIVLKSDL